MAQAMTPGAQSLFAQRLPKAPLHESADGYGFWYSVQKTGVQVIARRGGDSATGLIEWVLGAGVQGQTPMVRVGSTLFESRVSYFTRASQFGVTVDQPAGRSENSAKALGLWQSKREATSCLLCHSTGVTKDLQPEVPGVQCARCHPGASEHAATQGKASVINPGKVTAVQQVEICGACHRLTPPVDDQQLENVRFQPLRLKMSRCFGSGEVKCTTCHPAHQDVKRNAPEFYNEKCVVCHASSKGLHHEDERRDGNCVQCHMPSVKIHPAIQFTDHFIRVMSNKDPVYPFLAVPGG